MPSAYEKLLDKFDSIEEKKCIEPLFEDKFCKLYNDKLEIVWYYFPTLKSKFISIKDIKAVYFKKQNFGEDIGTTKGWGRSHTNVWWAWNWTRKGANELSGYQPGWHNIVIDNGEKTFKGFTNTSCDIFLDALRPLLPHGTEITQGMPYF